MRLGRDLEPIWPHNLYAPSHARSHLRSPPASSLLPIGIVRREAGTVSLVKMHVFLADDDDADCLQRKHIQDLLLISILRVIFFPSRTFVPIQLTI